jgi:NifU-like protein involved in Fe-S cluster formation
MAADRHAREAMVCAGNLNARYIDLVEDNRTLLEEIDKLSAKLDAQALTIKALEQAIAMIVEGAVFKTKCERESLMTTADPQAST